MALRVNTCVEGEAFLLISTRFSFIIIWFPSWCDEHAENAEFQRYSFADYNIALLRLNSDTMLDIAGPIARIPIPDPDMAIPKAKFLFSVKYWDIATTQPV